MRVFRRPAHVMMHTNGFAFVAVVLGMLATGEVDVVPWATLPWVRLVVYGACSWVGVCCFIALTRSWGATAAVRRSPALPSAHRMWRLVVQSHSAHVRPSGRLV